MRHLTLLIFVLSFSASGLAQVTYQRLLQAEQEPENWLTYSGTYSSNRHSRLDQITPGNVDDLELAWVFQARSLEPFQAMRIRRECLRKQLDGDLAIQIGIHRLPHHSHPALADLLDEAVVGQLLAGFEGHMTII